MCNGIVRFVCDKRLDRDNPTGNNTNSEYKYGHKFLQAYLYLLLSYSFTMDFKKALIVIAVATATPYIYKDYHEWLKVMVPGGLPGNFLGYTISCLVTTFAGRGDDVSKIDYTIPGDKPSKSFLAGVDIPQREGDTPEIAKWVLPQRQISPKKLPESTKWLQDLLEDVVASHDDCLIGTSFVEKGIKALFWSAHVDKYEVAHVHPVDETVHVYLMPEDAKIALTTGWGRLHPFKPSYHPPGIESTFFFSPRNEEDLKVYRKFIEAGIEASRYVH